VKTLSLDVNDLRGNTVTRINVDAASTDSWVSFDEYGNREGSSTGKLVTYDAYGQYERATTSQGLILMGARVYNPVTNQFTSPDPITGGNETSYTYPNDPINKTDFDGNWGWGDTLNLALTVACIVPIPFFQQVAWAVKAYQAVTVGTRAALLIAKLAVNLKKTGDVTVTSFRTTERVINAAGKIWAFKGKTIPYYSTYKLRTRFTLFRPAMRKESGKQRGKEVANFQFGPGRNPRSDSDWRLNMHVIQANPSKFLP
jgi:RHS repeat-associated protein